MAGGGRNEEYDQTLLVNKKLSEAKAEFDIFKELENILVCQIPRKLIAKETSRKFNHDSYAKAVAWSLLLRFGKQMTY